MPTGYRAERPRAPISERLFPSAARARWLSEKRLGAWLRAKGYCGRTTPSEPYRRLAGVAPSTRRCGRHRAVTFRWSADKRLPHAERVLARSWAHIIWRCWQDHTPYDPERHGGFQRSLVAQG